MEKIKDALKAIHFTDQEVEIYLYLLRNPGQTPFQISRDLHIPRTQVYQIVDTMYSQNKLVLEQNQKDIYYAEEPMELIKNLSNHYEKQFLFLTDELPLIKKDAERQPYLNINGFDDIIGKARTMLYEAKEEVYMNTDLDLNIFDDCFSFLEKKGVDVFVFSFPKTSYRRHNLFTYSYDLSYSKPSRIMLVTDLQQVMVGNYHAKRDEWMATLTKNQLMVDIITEHIHHDIYLIKLKQKLGSSLFELHPDLAIDSLHEKKRFKNVKRLSKEFLKINEK